MFDNFDITDHPILMVVCSIFGIFLAFFVIASFWCIVIERPICHKKAELYDTKTNWSYYTDCYAEKDGKMIPMHLYEKMIMPNAVYGNAEQNIKEKKMITELDIEQYSDEWWLERRGRFGASEATAVRVGGAGLKTLANKKSFNLSVPSEKQYLEHLKRTKDYKSEQMEMGSANELFAREAVENMYGIKIRQIGMCIYNDFAEFSTDGKIDKWNCGVEIKNIDSGTGQEKFLLATDGDYSKLPDYDQIQYSLALSDWDFWLYVLYSEVLWGEIPKVFIIPPEKELKQLYLTGIEKGEVLITENVIRYVDCLNRYNLPKIGK
jgi:hypothetical protein